MEMRWKVAGLIVLLLMGGWGACQAQSKEPEKPGVSEMMPATSSPPVTVEASAYIAGWGIAAESPAAIEQGTVQPVSLTLGQFVMAYTNNAQAAIYGFLRKEGQEYRLVPTSWETGKVEADLFSLSPESTSIDLPVGHLTLSPLSGGPQPGWSGQLLLSHPGEAEARSVPFLIVASPASMGGDILGGPPPASAVASLISMGYTMPQIISALFPGEGGSSAGASHDGKVKPAAAGVREATSTKVQDQPARQMGHPTSGAPDPSGRPTATIREAQPTTKTDSSIKLGPSSTAPEKKDFK